MGSLYTFKSTAVLCILNLVLNLVYSSISASTTHGVAHLTSGIALLYMYLGMWNFVSADKIYSAFPLEIKFHIQKYDGLKNIENPSRALAIGVFVGW